MSASNFRMSRNTNLLYPELFFENAVENRVSFSWEPFNDKRQRQNEITVSSKGYPSSINYFSYCSTDIIYLRRFLFSFTLRLLALLIIRKSCSRSMNLPKSHIEYRIKILSSNISLRNNGRYLIISRNIKHESWWIVWSIPKA